MRVRESPLARRVAERARFLREGHIQSAASKGAEKLARLGFAAPDLNGWQGPLREMPGNGPLLAPFPEMGLVSEQFRAHLVKTTGLPGLLRLLHNGSGIVQAGDGSGLAKMTPGERMLLYNPPKPRPVPAAPVPPPDKGAERPATREAEKAAKLAVRGIEQFIRAAIREAKRAERATARDAARTERQEKKEQARQERIAAHLETIRRPPEDVQIKIEAPIPRTAILCF